MTVGGAVPGWCPPTAGADDDDRAELVVAAGPAPMLTDQQRYLVGQEQMRLLFSLAAVAETKNSSLVVGTQVGLLVARIGISVVSGNSQK